MATRTKENESETYRPGVPGRLFGGIKHYISDIRRFSRNVRLYLLGSALMGLNFQVFLVLFNLYLKELGYPEGDIGQFISARAVGMTMVAIPAAILLGRLRLKPFLLTSCVLLAIFSFVMVTYPVYHIMLMFAILAGMSFAIFRVAGGPFFMRNSTKVERTHVFSFSFGMMLLAGMIGSVGSGELAAAIGDYYGDIILGYKYALYIGIAVALLALVPFALIEAASPSKDENRIRLNREQLRRRGKFYFKIMLANLIIGSGAGLVIPFLTLYFRDRFGLPPDAIGKYYALVHFSMLAGTLIGPVLARRFGLVRTVVMTQLASIPFMLILSYSYILPLSVAAFVVRGGLMNLGVPITNNLGMELAEENEQGLANALLMIAWTGSWMFSSVIGGHLIEAYGYTVAMNITVTLYVTSSIVFYSFFRKAEVHSEKEHAWVIVRENVI